MTSAALLRAIVEQWSLEQAVGVMDALHGLERLIWDVHGEDIVAKRWASDEVPEPPELLYDADDDHPF